MADTFRALCAELTAWAEKTSAHYFQPPDVLLRARAALSVEPAVPEGREPATPPADGEVAELVAALQSMATDADRRCRFSNAERLSRAADLLERQQTVPVAVSERLPAMVTDGLRVAGDCDEQGRCWAGTRASVDTSGDRDIDLPPSWELREVCAQDDVWLPAHSLPLPEVNV